MKRRNTFRLYFSTKVARPTGADDKAPKWNLLVPLGPHFRDDLPDGKMDVTSEMVETMRANWMRANKPRVRGDYFHMGGSDVQQVPLENKIASGWAVELKCDDKGLWALIDWTDRARGFILADELASLSPEIYFNPVDRLHGGRQGATLTSFGLLNDPSFTQLPHVAAAAPSEEDDTMLKALFALLGLAENASENDVTAAITALKTKNTELGEQVTKLTATNKDLEAEKVKLTASGDDKLKTLREESVQLAARLEKLEKEKVASAKAEAERVKVALCEKLEAQGRIVAADKERIGKLVDAMGLDEATKFCATMPVKVPMGERGHGEGAEGADLSKAEANAQFKAKVDELAAKEPKLKASELYARVKAANPDLAKAAFRN